MIRLDSQLTQLLSVPPGDLVYHLIVLFAIEAILMMAIAEGRHSNWTSSTLRRTLAAGGLLIARLALVVVALLSAAGVINSAWVAPPLERFAAVASLGLLIWAFLPWVDDYPQAGLVLVVVNLVASVILYAVFAPQWYTAAQSTGTFYNATLADWVWNVWAVALAALAMIGSVLRRRGPWGMLVAAFGLLLVGHMLHLFMADTQTHIAGWVRLAELCVYPILAGLMLRRATEREEPAPTASTTPWALIEACQRVGDALNVNVALQRAGVAISNVLSADVLAIGQLNEAGNTIELGAVCRMGMPARSGPSFDIESQLPVQSAINRQRGVSVGVEQEAQRATLAALVGGASGSLWVQPLIYQRATTGVLIIGRAHTTADWTASELQTLNGLCNVLAVALSTARKNNTLARQAAELSQQIRNKEKELEQARAEVQSSKGDLQRKGQPPQAAPRAPVRLPEATPSQPATSRPAPTLEPLNADHRPFFEAVKRLQQIGDAHARLTTSPGDRDTLFEIYRASVSLKGISVAMGYNTLAKLAGTLADALQRARDSQLPPTAELLALIGESTAALRTLLADAQADRSPSLDITLLLRRLESPAERSAPLRRAPTGSSAPKTSTPIAPPPSNGRTLTAQVQLDRHTPLKAARAMMVLTQIKRVGQIIACQPVEADLRSGGFGDEFEVTFTTLSDPETVRAALVSIRDVTNVLVQ
jgi:GAF domain-containing protein